jgi:diguanylate cyclase (GGDEF)-like protein
MRQRDLNSSVDSRRGEVTTDGLDLIDASSSIRHNPTKWLILCGILLIAAIAIATAFIIDNFRERTLKNSERELENTVLMLARHFDQQLEDFEAVQNDLIAEFADAGITSPDVFSRQMSTPEIHQWLKAKVSGSSDATGVGIYDAKGTMINISGESSIPAINIADRAYFNILKSGSAQTPPQIELIRSRFSGNAATVLARRVSGPNGEFLGIVTRVFALARFEEFFSSVALGKGAAISMHHRDGTLLARYPHAEAMVGKNFKTGPALQAALLSLDQGNARLISPVDGQERLVSVRALSHFPLSVVATTTVASALADWREQTRFLIIAAALSALVIAFILSLIVRQLSRQHRSSQRRLALEKQRLDTAVDNMTQGLTLFDASRRLVVCNQRYIDMYGLSRDVVKRGCSLRDLIAHRKQMGSLQGDIDEHCSRILNHVLLNEDGVIHAPDGRAVQITHRLVADGGWVATHEDITERRRSDERIAYLAHYDALTSLANRVLFREQLEQQLDRIQGGEELAVLYIDIDEFKGINDSLGHSVGDELLKAVAARLRSCVRDNDLIARLGGDEFAIVQTGVKHPTDVTDLVARIYKAMRQPCECLGHQLTTDASIGVAMAPGDGADLDQLLKNADLAMYSAKADGRRTHRFFKSGMDARIKARRTLETDLRQAIVDGGFEIHYQPVVNLQSDEVTGCEALLRWRHPARGMISPAEFIPVAEETGLINQLGEWVLTTACAEAVTWPDHVRLAVNVSPVQFKSCTLALKVATALAASGLQASRLELEITEAVLIRDDEEALAILHQLRALGVRIALDDFGTGYSSLSYLQRFPFDKIKIDRCFVNNIAELDGSSAIVQAVVNIAISRNMTTTAEGVETEQQRKLLHTLGCTEMQGYLFAAAKPAVDVRPLLFAHPEKLAVVA